MSHTKSGQKALKEIAEREWRMSRPKDRERLTFLTDEMLKGHRGDDILKREDTYDDHPAIPTVENNFWTGKQTREVTYDPTAWTVLGGGVVGENALMQIEMEE